jgi:hypothetical protein
MKRYISLAGAIMVGTVLCQEKKATIAEVANPTLVERIVAAPGAILHALEATISKPIVAA